MVAVPNELENELFALKRLRISEISGVDDPASEIPGWLILKSADGAAGRSLYEALDIAERVFKSSKRTATSRLRFWRGETRSTWAATHDDCAVIRACIDGVEQPELRKDAHPDLEALFLTAGTRSRPAVLPVEKAADEEQPRPSFFRRATNAPRLPGFQFFR